MTTMELARFASELEYEQLPSTVVEMAKMAVQDFVGVSLFVSRNTPWGRVIAEFAASDGRGGEATIIGHSRKTIPSLAALANGTMALGFEYEDVHIGSHTHPHSAIVSSALAIAEKEKASGKKLITAVVAGYEVIARTSLASGKSLGTMVTRGLYPLALFGPFGAAAAAGRIMGLEPQKMAMAFGLAGEQSGGTAQSHAEGAWSRRWHGGKAAEHGITAALLARAGFIGPVRILEGEVGLYRAFGLDFAPQRLTEGLGKSYEIMDTWFKAYSCCAAFHTAIDSVLHLRREHRIQPDEVRKVMVYLRKLTPLHKRKDFPTIIAAQYSAPFCIATAMLRGSVSPAEFTEETIRDPEVVNYARERLEVEFDETLSSTGEENRTAPSRIVVQLKDGREYRREAMFPTGHPRNPMTQDQLREKFNALATTVLEERKAEKLYTLVRALEEVKHVTELAELLQHPEDRG